MAAEILIVGGGVGGTSAANLIARQTQGDANVTIVDATGIHVYEPAFLHVAVGLRSRRRCTGWSRSCCGTT